MNLRDIPMTRIWTFLNVLSVFLCVLLVFSSATAQSQSSDVSWKKPYYDSVPAILDRIEEAFLKLDNTQEIEAWAQAMNMRLPEFLQDMIQASADLEQTPFPYDDITPVLRFEQKWMDIFSTCPDCQEIFPLLKPMAQDMFANFPPLPKQYPGELGTQYLYRLYQALSDINPWRLGTFFDLPPLEKKNRVLTVQERSAETITAGVKKTFVNYRKVFLRENLRVKFIEIIQNDKVVQENGDQALPTMLHEIAETLANQGADPKLVKALQDLTAYIDELLRASWESGRTDDFSYYYLYSHVPIKNEMVYTIHPFLLHPENFKDYKVREFYPRTFINHVYAGFGWKEYADWAQEALGLAMNEPGIQSFSGPKSLASSAATASSSVLQPAPSEERFLNEPAAVAPSTSTGLHRPLENPAPPLVSDVYINGMQRILNLWASGFFIPLYLFGLVGISKILGL